MDEDFSCAADEQRAICVDGVNSVGWMWQPMAAVRKVGPGLTIVSDFEEFGDRASMMKFRNT